MNHETGPKERENRENGRQDKDSTGQVDKDSTGGQRSAECSCKWTRIQGVVKVSTGLNRQSRIQQVAKDSMHGQSMFWEF